MAPKNRLVEKIIGINKNRKVFQKAETQPDGSLKKVFY